ncbi:hypothetical protein EV665_10331 [Shinella granuli]|uniref:Uncharacterized protein n=2 Tax=Shinella granuli TaxID=323621 RepID=A0A4R2CZN9_SHIGR|nr:hypothetical protein EV665_10331 [Shinella granuli]
MENRMKIPSKRDWLNAACRDPRLDHRHFRVAAAIWSRSDGSWRARIDPARLSVQTGLSQAECTSAIRRLVATGYLHVIGNPNAVPFMAALALPAHLPERKRAPALSPWANEALAAPAIGRNCLPLLRAVKGMAERAAPGRFIPWRQIIKEVDVEPPRAGERGDEYARRREAARKRLSRLRAACLDAGAIEVDQARGVRLTPDGELAVAAPG